MNHNYYSSAVRNILECAFNQLQDAHYDNMAEVIIGNDFVLLDEDAFNELRDLIAEEFGTEYVNDKEFREIVNTEE